VSRRRREPSDEEAALWKQVAKTVTPLHPERAKPKPVKAAKESPPAKSERPDGPRAAQPVSNPPPARAKPPPALNAFDRRTMSRLGRGITAIDARIDLHGLTQARAHVQLIDFLRSAQASGARVVLVITGKGGNGRGEERGVLRRVVPVWLSSSELRPLVVGFDEAGRSHGGAGALYVRIRRRR
jgi:DNA-nicking Smr family endonuclease